ncbi:MAG: homoserine dehydrogenase [Bacteroidota bacterium]
MKKIGLFGFGCVARGFYEGLQATKSDEVSIKKICIQDPSKERGLPAHLYTTEADDILLDPEIDLVIELIDQAEPALDIVSTSLRRGVPTISANKKMIAENLEALLQIMEETQTPFRYEGAVGGSIPILESLENYYSNQPIHQIRAILNGSTNYILTKMKFEGISFDMALKQAQELGFAETDPSLDVEGHDAMFKTIILAHQAFGQVLTPADVDVQGIDQLSPYLLQQGRKEYSKVKLIATLRMEGQTLLAKVEPQVLEHSDLLYPIDNEYNAMEIDGAFSGKQLLVGKGAGCLPTGSAVLSDMNIILQGMEAGVRVE